MTVTEISLFESASVVFKVYAPITWQLQKMETAKKSAFALSSKFVQMLKISGLSGSMKRHA